MLPTVVYDGRLPPRTMSLAVPMLISDVYEYGATFPLPMEPAEMRTLALSNASAHFIHGSSDMRHAREPDGNIPHLEFDGNFDEPS